MFMKRQDEAMAQMKRVLELDPLNPMCRVQYAVLLTSMGRYDGAIEVYRSVLRTVPNHPSALSGLQTLFYAKGMYEEALEFGKANLAALQLPEAAEAMERGYEEAGYLGAFSRAAETLATMSRKAYVAPPFVAYGYALSGRKQKALDWLERGCEERHPLMPGINVSLAYATLHDEPRFQDLLRRMNLP
jgi:tetratricopeptide (TPR) repeat protein